MGLSQRSRLSKAIPSQPTPIIPEGAYISTVIKNGTACVEDEVHHMNVSRSSTVKFFCGETLALAQVEEVKSCEYVMSITIPRLCKVDGFKRSHIDFKPV